MSAESYLDEKTPSLSVDIPTTYPSSSVESSLASSPTGILYSSRSPTYSTSTSSLQAHLNVTFAPLPKLAPRKRRSTAPLGMAARNQLMGRRRRYHTDAYQGGNPMWTDEELEQQRLDQDAKKKRTSIDGEEGTDPFLALGKIVKGAGKSIWRKVSNKDLSKQTKEQTDENGKKSTSSSVGARDSSEIPESAPTIPEPPEERIILAPIIPNGDNTSENDEESDERFLSVGQTETIVEGHTKYSWVNGKEEDNIVRSMSVPKEGASPMQPPEPGFRAL